MKKVVTVAMVSVGTMIGAGYASGQEIVAFFGGSPSLLVPAVCGLIMFALTACLLAVGARVGDDANAVMFGRLSFVVDAVMLLNALIVLSAMIAGMNELMADMTGAPLPFGLMLAAAGVIVLRRGNDGLRAANTLIVPLIVIVMTLTCTSVPLSPGSPDLSALPSCFTYVSMNLLLSAGVLVRQGKMTRREILLSSALSSVIISALMALICCALPAAASSDMPMLSVARGSQTLYVLFALCLAVSIFTTLLSALALPREWGLKRGQPSAAMLFAVAAASLLADVGFRGVVDMCYPVIGVLGAAYLLRCAVFLSPAEQAFRKRHESVHTAREHAQRDGGGHHEVGTEHLTAVYDEVSQPRTGHEVFAHHGAHPRQSDVYLDRGEKGGKGGGQDGVAQDLQAARAHGTQQHQFIRGGGA